MPDPLIPSQEARSLYRLLDHLVRDEEALCAIDEAFQAIRRDEAEQCARVVGEYRDSYEAAYKAASTAGGADQYAARANAASLIAAALRARHAGESPDGR